MQIVKQRAFSILYGLLGAILIAPQAAYAACTSPAANAGQIDYFSAAGEQVHRYCDGTNWVPWAGRIISGAPAPLFSSSGLVAGGADTQIQFNSAGTFAGDADLTWNAATNTMTVINIDYTGYLTDTSDRRLKENIEPLTGALGGVLALEGYSFTMKDDANAQREYGLMAQDVQAVFPELVLTRDNDYLSLNYVGLIAPLVEATKEQQKLIDTLTAQNADLEARLKALESRYGTAPIENGTDASVP